MSLQRGSLSPRILLFAMSTAFTTASLSPDALAASTEGAHRNIEYARPGGTPLYMDAALPEGSGPFPAAIIVHGGGWVGGNRQIDVAPLFKPLQHAGIAWFSIDYRLSSDILQFG